MTKEQIIQMLKDLVNEIDYDLYKEMFVYDERSGNLGQLIKIVQKHESMSSR